VFSLSKLSRTQTTNAIFISIRSFTTIILYVFYLNGLLLTSGLLSEYVTIDHAWRRDCETVRYSASTSTGNGDNVYQSIAGCIQSLFLMFMRLAMEGKHSKITKFFVNLASDGMHLTSVN